MEVNVRKPPSFLGKHHTEETKKKISLSHIGKTFTEEHKKHLSESHIGQKPSMETLLKLSESRRGSKSHLWKGGVSPENKRIRRSIEYMLWRVAVFSRDNWTCMECGKRGGTLHPHHIKFFSEFPELRFAIDNGITLCKKCHQTYHSQLKLSEGV